MTDRASHSASPTALITGGSRGIGRALAAEFAADGHDLVLVARDPDRLERAADDLERRYEIDATSISIDLSRADAPAEVASRVADQDLRVDALVNNAGMATYGPVAETDPEALREQFAVNAITPALLTRQFLPEMLERDAGTIAIVASTAAFRPGPSLAGYHASKAAALSFAESLAEECRGTGVSVTALCPGPTETGVHERSGRELDALERQFAYSPERVARVGYEGIRAGETVVIPGRRHEALAAVGRLLPGEARRRLSGWMTERSR